MYNRYRCRRHDSIHSAFGFFSSGVLFLILLAILAIGIFPSIYPLLGYQVSEMIGKTVFEFCHPDDARVLSKWLPSDTDRFKCRLCHKKGHYLWFETAIKKNRSTTGDKQLTIGISRDVSEQMRMEESLLKSEEKYKLIAENMNDFVCTVDQRRC